MFSSSESLDLKQSLSCLLSLCVNEGFSQTFDYCFLALPGREPANQSGLHILISTISQSAGSFVSMRWCKTDHRRLDYCSVLLKGAFRHL